MDTCPLFQEIFFYYFSDNCIPIVLTQELSLCKCRVSYIFPLLFILLSKLFLNFLLCFFTLLMRLFPYFFLSISFSDSLFIYLFICAYIVCAISPPFLLLVVVVLGCPPPPQSFMLEDLLNSRWLMADYSAWPWLTSRWVSPKAEASSHDGSPNVSVCVSLSWNDSVFLENSFFLCMRDLSQVMDRDLWWG
jgi:hypothetical protein